MQYAQFKENVHVADSFENLPIESLKLNDSVFIISETKLNHMTSLNTKLTKIEDGFYKFLSHDDVSKTQYNGRYYSGTTSTWGAEYLSQQMNEYVFLNLNNKLTFIFNEKNSSGTYNSPLTTDFFKFLYEEYFAKNFGKIITKTFKQRKRKKNEEYDNNVLALMTLPIENDKTIFFIRVVDNNDYVMIMDKVDITGKVESPYMYMEFYGKCKIYGQNLTDMMPSLFKNIGLDNKEVKNFHDILFATKYELRNYLEDKNQDQNIEFASNILKKIKHNEWDLKTLYAPKFEFKGFAGHLHDRQILFTYNGEFLQYNDGPDSEFKDKRYQISLDGISEYVVKLPESLKSKTNQGYYKIVYSMMEFMKDKNGIDPVTGDYYKYGELNNSYITYKDNEGIIAGDRHNTYYTKKLGYYIFTNSDQIKKQIDERRKLMEMLSKKAE